MQENNEIPVRSEQELTELLKIRRDKLSALRAEGKDPYAITSYDRDAFAADIVSRFGEYEGRAVSVAGRLTGWRDMGKATFLDLLDSTGRIQIYVKIDGVGEESYAEFGKWDIGDIVGVTGEAFRTRRGEISVKATGLKLLSKSLLPLPEKWHGLKDTDIRYRQRYVDLIVNPEVKDAFLKRSGIISEIRRFLDAEGFVEVETPVLHTQAGGAAARPFITHHNALNLDIYLRIALELHLKRLIVGGFDKVYEIGRVFRNEGMDTSHNPEFTMLELYQAYTDYEGMMDIVERMFRTVAEKVLGKTTAAFGGVEIDLGKPFARLSMKDAVKQYSGVDFDDVKTVEQARALAKEHNIEFEMRHGKGGILNLFFEEYVEDKLVQPTFITRHPTEISPLAKKCPDDLCARVFIHRVERIRHLLCGNLVH